MGSALSASSGSYDVVVYLSPPSANRENITFIHVCEHKQNPSSFITSDLPLAPSFQIRLSFSFLFFDTIKVTWGCGGLPII